jgi:hypothetical protein
MKINKDIWEIASGEDSIVPGISLRTSLCSFGFEMCLRENKNSRDENNCHLWLIAVPKIEITLLGGKQALKKIFKNLKEGK